MENQAEYALAVTDNFQPAYHLSKPEQVSLLAQDLKKHIQANKLSTLIQGRDYVQVEGWQFAGGLLGLAPVVTHITDISIDGEVKYQAGAEIIRLSDGQVVGRGFAICSNKEKTKVKYEEYAIASMAQTRAIGKAYRNVLAWVMKMAGYEPTPAEEMTQVPENATGAQVLEIVKLLNSHVFNQDERLSGISKISGYNTDSANRMIDKLKALVKDREDILQQEHRNANA